MQEREGEKGRLRTVYTYLRELRAGRLGDSDAIPDTAGGEGSHRDNLWQQILFAQFASVTQLREQGTFRLPSFAALRLPLSTHCSWDIFLCV